jgi:hypothetical protein
MATPIPLFGPGLRAKSPYVTAKQLVNMYCEQRPVGEKASIVAYGTPGLELFSEFGATPLRGGIKPAIGSLAYVVHRGVFYEVNASGATTNRGALLTTTGRVSMAFNGVQVMIVDGTAGYIYNTSTNAFAQITDGDFVANPTTVTYLGLRFVVTTADENIYQWSDINDGLSWDALNFAPAEASPDPILAVLATNGQLALLGTETTEFSAISGDADAAFTALQGTASEWGLAATWSLAKFDNTYACLMKNRMGQVMVAQLAGYLPRKISTPDIDSIINDYSTVEDATAYSYMLGGHPMYVISFPIAGESWLYDGSTGFWSRLSSTGHTRHLGEFGFSFDDSTYLVSDYSTGRLYRLTSTVYTDNGAAISRQLVTENVAVPGQLYLSAEKLRLDIEVGVGLASGQGSDPQIGLEVSRDNGKTWGAQMWKSLGVLGAYGETVEWRRLGTSRTFNFRLTVTDPVPVTIVAAALNPET